MARLSAFKQHPIFRDTLALATGGLLAQTLSIAVAPLLSRYYGPEDFGVFSLYAFSVMVPSALVSWSYEAAIPLPKDNGEARDLLVLTIAIVSFMSILAIGPLFASDKLARLVNAPTLAPLLALVPLNLFALGVYQAFTYWHNRTGDFGRLAVSRLFQSGLTAGGQLGLGIYEAGAGGLVTGYVIGQLAAPVYLGWAAMRRSEIDPGYELRRSALFRMLYRYRRFPLFTSWGTLTGLISFLVVPVLLSRQFGPLQAGLYFFGYRLVSSGALLLTSSVGQVLYQRASMRIHAGKQVAPLVEGVLARLGILAFLVFGGFAIIAPQLFAFLFGPQWATAGHYMRIVSPMFFLQFIAAPVSMVLFPLEKQHVAAFMQLALLLGALGSLTLASLAGATPDWTLALYGTVQGLTYLTYLLLILRLASVSPRSMWRAIAGRSRSEGSV